MVLPAWVWGVLDIWAACRVPGGMGVQHLLPVSGAAAEQPAGLMDALAMIDELMQPPKEPG